MTKEVYNTSAAIQKLASETATAVQKYNEAVSSINRLGATGSWNGGAGSGGSGTGTEKEYQGITPSTGKDATVTDPYISENLGVTNPSS